MGRFRDYLNAWLHAARPRTVLLSLSGILMGGLLAIAERPDASCWTLAFCALTAVLLQILSNLANDYGDFKKGVDNAHRTGPQRVLQSGALTESQMRIGIFLTVLMCLGSGLLLLLSVVLLQGAWHKALVFALVGVAAIAAAEHRTGYDADAAEYVVEGPRIERMLGYTNLDSEKGFRFFQDFLKTNGILEELEALGIQDGDTVRMYGLSFDYYK